MTPTPPPSPVPSFRHLSARRVFDVEVRRPVASSWGVATRDVSIWECPATGLRFREPQPDQRLEDFYAADYHAQMTGDEEQGARRRAYRKENELRAAHLQRHMSGGPVLDVGCSNGDFAQVMQAAGFEAFGLDISADACEKCKGVLGEDHVYCGALEERAAGLQQRFAAVTMMDVIEHCDDPVRLLGALHSVLRPGGVLFLRTPTLGSPFHFVGALSYRLTFGMYKIALLKLYHAEHLYFFNERSIRRMLDDCGFDVLEVSPDPLCWENFRTAELRQGPIGNLLLAVVYFVGRALHRGHGMKVVARRRDEQEARGVR